MTNRRDEVERIIRDGFADDSDHVVAMETVSDEMLAEMMAGLEGVSAGPWEPARDFAFQTDPLSILQPAATAANGGYKIANFYGPDREANAKHAQRLDPATVRSIISELLASRLAKQAPDDDPVLRFAKWQHEGDALASAAGCSFTLKVKSPNSTWTITSRPTAPSPVGGSVS